MGHLGAILNAIATSQCRYIWFKTQKADRWLDAHQPLAMKVLILFFIVLAPLWVSEAKFNFQGISSGIRSILGSVSKTVIKSSIKELGSRSLQKIEDTVSRNLAKIQNEDLDLKLDIQNYTVEIGKYLDAEKYVLYYYVVPYF